MDSKELAELRGYMQQNGIMFCFSGYMTEAIKRKRKGDLAVANLEISSALRDLVTHISRKAAFEAVKYMQEKHDRQG